MSFWLMRKKATRRKWSQCLIGFGLSILVTHWHIVNAYGITGSMDYLWEQKKIEGKRQSQFTQIYDLIFSRRLQPLYDTSVKFEFRSETYSDEKSRERTELLPSINMRFGQEMMNLSTGWSKDTIKDEEGDYTNERIYSSFGWRPKLLPHVLLQFEGQRKEQSWEEGPVSEDERISLKEDYTVRFGLITLDHSYSSERKSTEDTLSTLYDLLNTARIGNRFSFFDKRLDIRTGYEVNQGQKKEEDKERYNTLKNNIHLDITGQPVVWMKPQYRVFWGDMSGQDKRETSQGHNLVFFLNPYPYLPSTLGANYNRNESSQDPGPREVITYSLKLEPRIHGLLFDQEMSMYPTKTSLLLSSSTDRSMGARQTHTLSLLLTGSTTIKPGIDLDLDMGLNHRKGFVTKSTSLEEKIDARLNLSLLPDLKASIRPRANWIRERVGGTEISDYDGDIETRIIYRAVETFMLDVGYTVAFGDYESSYQYSFNWRPTSKMEIEVRYQSGTREREGFFSGGMNLNISRTIRMELDYQYPSEDQALKLQLTIRF